MVKTCTKCKQTKTIESFYRNRARKDGRMCWCKVCCKHWKHRPKSDKAKRLERETSQTKVCTGCDNLLPLDAFPRYKGRRKDTHARCTSCYELRREFREIIREGPTKVSIKKEEVYDPYKALAKAVIEGSSGSDRLHVKTEVLTWDLEEEPQPEKDWDLICDNILDDPWWENESTTIYFIEDTSSGLIKIGRTRNLEKRLYGIKTNNPTVELRGCLNNVNPLWENRLHEEFSEDCVSGEWFQPSDRLLSFIKEKAA